VGVEILGFLGLPLLLLRQHRLARNYLIIDAVTTCSMSSVGFFLVVLLTTIARLLPTRSVAAATAAGVITSTRQTLLDNAPVACEWEWTIRLLAPSAINAMLPRRMYHASCSTHRSNNTNTNGTVTTTTKMFTSYTVGTDRDETRGAITVTVLDAPDNRWRVEGTFAFPECISMHGIAAMNDNCGTVAALCLRRSSAENDDYQFDPVTRHPEADWISSRDGAYCQKKSKNDPQQQLPNRQMWLYEWENADLSQPPTNKVVVHKSMGAGAWDYGQNYLRYGDNTYGIALKTTTSDCVHEGDSFLVLDRTDWTFQKQQVDDHDNNYHHRHYRGWTWGCAKGHIIHNRPAYDAVSRRYAVLCSSDWNEQEKESVGCEVALRYDDQPRATIVHHVPRYGPLWIKGGAGPLVARPNGGFVGIVVGEPPEQQRSRRWRRRGGNGYYDDTTPVQLGLLRVTADGKVLPILWNVVVPHEQQQYYLSWPQLAWLGEGDRYFLGWARGYQSCAKYDNDDRDVSLRHPWAYFVMEISGDGDVLVPAQDVSAAGVGWGEVNEMVTIGPGRVGWSYVPRSLRRSDSASSSSSNFSLAAPNCNQNQLVHYVYTSPDAVFHNDADGASSLASSATTSSIATEPQAAEDFSAVPDYERTTLDCFKDSWPPGSHSSTTRLSLHHCIYCFIVGSIGARFLITIL
jgi:hypothetical protein